MKKSNKWAQDNLKDEEKLQPESIIINMPEVKDIPGQENITPPRMKEMEDTTISSADEEGEGILDDLNNDNDGVSDNNSNVSSIEKKLLKKSAGHQPSEESNDMKRMALDERDNDGDLLNEKSISTDKFGEDLDVPGSELDDEDEDTGEEDEENNNYSQRD